MKKTVGWIAGKKNFYIFTNFTHKKRKGSTDAASNLENVLTKWGEKWIYRNEKLMRKTFFGALFRDLFSFFSLSTPNILFNEFIWGGILVCFFCTLCVGDEEIFLLFLKDSLIQFSTLRVFALTHLRSQLYHWIFCYKKVSLAFFSFCHFLEKKINEVEWKIHGAAKFYKLVGKCLRRVRVHDLQTINSAVVHLISALPSPAK